MVAEDAKRAAEAAVNDPKVLARKVAKEGKSSQSVIVVMVVDYGPPSSLT